MSKDTTPKDINPDPRPLAGWIEVFRAGTHTDSKGRVCSFTHADLDQMVRNHALGAAPIVLGHPRDDDPAYGWVEDYRREGDSLFARFADINPQFAQAVAGGAYRNRSVSVFKDAAHGWRVRHVGFLGAVPPAIDGLKPLQFAVPAEACHEFSHDFAGAADLVWGLESAAQALAGLRDWLIERDGVEAAEKVLPQWRIESIKEAAATARADYRDADVAADAGTAPAPANSFNAPQGDEMSQEQEDALAAAQAAQKAAEDKLAEFAAAHAAKEAELQTLRKERQTERLTAQVEGLVKAGKVTPAQRAGMVEFMASIEDSAAQEFAFSAADGEAKKTPVQWFIEFARSLPVQAQLGRASAAGDAGASVPMDAADIANKAREYMAEQQARGVTVELHEAVAHVSGMAA